MAGDLRLASAGRHRPVIPKWLNRLPLPLRAEDRVAGYDDLRRLRLKGLIYRPPKTHRYFLTPHGGKIARLFSRLEARVFRPAVAMFTSNDAVSTPGFA